MAVQRLRAADRHRRRPLAEGERDRPRLGHVADRRRRRVGVDVVDLPGRRRRRRRGRSSPPARPPCRRPAAGPCGARPRSRRSPSARRTGPRRARSATSAASRTSSAAPSPMTNPSRPGSNGRAAAPGLVVVAGRQRPDDVEGAERERAQRDLARRRRSRRRSGPRAGRRAPRRARPHPTRTSWRSTGSARGRRARCRGWPVPRRRRRPAPGSGRPGGSLARGTARAAPRRRRCRQAPSRGRSRSAAGARRRRPPGVSPASSSASRPATSPNWLNRSSWRAVFGGIQASGSKSSTWAATCERNGLGSNRSIRLTGERPARSPARNASRPVPIAVIDADPGDPDPPSLGHVGGFAGARRIRTATRLGERLERRQRPAGDRPREGAVDERREERDRGRKSWSMATRVPLADGSMRQVTSIPLVAPGDVDEAQAPRRGLVPRPRPPGHRQAEPEDADERTAAER